jgi:MurNAc alpha-1-phosphate uridylyltransferase
VPDPGSPPQVVVLAGGLGTRLRPLVEDAPKALVTIRGEPFARHQLRLLASQGVRRVVYVVGYRGDQIREAIDGGCELGLAMTFVDEGGELHGTGGALRFAHDTGALEDVFGVLYGDSYLPIDLAPVWGAFETGGRPALMTVLRNDDRWDRSNTVYEDGAVVLYDKRPEHRHERMTWIDYGFSVLRRDVVEEIPSGAVADLGDLFRDLSLRGDLAGFEVASRFYEAGSPEGLADLDRYLASLVPYSPRP